jgi:hypothetical protein
MNPRPATRAVPMLGVMTLTCVAVLSAARYLLLFFYGRRLTGAGGS